MNKYMKIISYILTIAVLSTIIPYNFSPVYAQAINESNTMAVIDKNSEITGTDDAIVGEDIEKREKFVKHFIKKDGTYEAAVYPEAVHYMENGKWKDIDNTFAEKKSDSNEEVFENKANAYKVSIAKSAESKKLIRLKSDEHEISWGIKNARKSKAAVLNTSNTVNAKTQQMKKISLPNLKSGVIFQNVLPFIDVQYDVHPEQLKENIILKQRTDNPQINIELEVKSLKPVMKENNSLIFYDSEETGNPVFIMAAPVMIDANGEHSERINLTLAEDKKGSYTLSIKPDNNSPRAIPMIPMEILFPI